MAKSINTDQTALLSKSPVFTIFAILTIPSKHLIVPEQIVNADWTVPDG